MRVIKVTLILNVDCYNVQAALEKLTHDMSRHGVVDKPPALCPGVLSLISCSSSLLDEALSDGPVSI